MPTEKLYWDEPTTFSFETTGARVASWQDEPALVLPRTVFYAEGGGQLGDTGTLRVGSQRLRVVDTQIDEAGDIFHVLDAPAVVAHDAAIIGSIDVDRRRDMMAHHTAQHMLSRAVLDVARAATVSARLSLGSCTIDFDKASLPDADLASAEDLVNAIVRDDVTVRAFFPNEEELKSLDLRRAPKVQSGIRIVEVSGFDLTPCGGSHVTRSGQIGAVRVIATERYKGKMRATFVAAARVLVDARAKDKLLGELARDMTCGLGDIPANVARLRAELAERVDALAKARAELVRHVAGELLSAARIDPSGTTVVRVLRDGDDVGALRTLAGRLSAREDVVAICGSKDASGEVLVIVQRGGGTNFDCGAWLKETAARLGGRGGGRPERAEGKLPAAFAGELDPQLPSQHDRNDGDSGPR